MSGPMKAAALVAIFLAVPAAAGDEGDDFSNNLVSDLAPLLALFGERVTTQFMGQAMGWADNIILAMGPLGIVTIIVSAIRVGGPIWLRAIVGRARENHAAAESDVMSSTSDEVCELWNGRKVVRVAGEAPIAEFICLFPQARHVQGTSGDSASNDGTSSGHRTANAPAVTSPNSSPDGNPAHLNLGNDPFEVVSLAEAEKKKYLQRIEQGDSFGSKLARGLGLLTNFVRRRQEELPDDVEKITDTANDTSPPIPTTTKLILVRNKEKAAPNLLLNIDRFSSPAELWAGALVGIVLQLGVLLYSAFITYHPALMFPKGDSPITGYAYPCTAVGTVLLVTGLLVCSHVVESSTREEFYQPRDSEARMVYLQKTGTVNDQSFGSFAIFAKEGKSVIATSRREQISATHEITTVLATLISLSGFVVQFVGLRSMHWSATVAQLGVTIAMTILRAIVRRDLATTPTARKLSPNFELDWLATNLALKFFPGLPRAGDTGGVAPSPSSQPPGHEHTDRHATGKRGEAKRHGTTSSSEWLEMSPGCGKAEATSLPAQSWLVKTIPASRTLDSENLGVSTAHYAMRLRKGLGDLAPWPKPFFAEARAVATAIESTLNFLDDLSAFSPLVETGDIVNDGDSGLTKPLAWHVDTVHHGMIYFTVHKSEGRWKADETEIEAALSLWNYSTRIHDSETSSAQTAGLDDTSLPKPDPAPQRILRSLGVNSARLRRDLRWWLPNETIKVMAVSRIREQAEVAAHSTLNKDYHGIIGCGLSQCSPGWTEALHYRAMELQRPFDTAFPLEPQDIFLATVSEQPARLLFSQHLFTAFMWALAEKLRRPLQGRANVQVSDLSQLDTPLSWQHFTLQNLHLSRLAQEIHATGLGSLEDVYLCLIPPLSLTHRLPRTDSVVDWVHQQVVRPGLVGRWEDAVEAFVWLLGTFPSGDPVEAHVAPSAVSLLLSLVQDLETQKRQAEPETRVIILERLKEELEIKLGTSDAARASFAVFRKHGSAWISHVNWEKVVKLGPPVSIVEYPAIISSVLENKGIETGGDQVFAKYPANPANLGQRDAFGRSALHYATLSPWSNFETLVEARPTIDAQDKLGWTPLHFASSCDYGMRVPQLIQAGADTGLRTQDGLTPLHCAAMAGNFHAVVELINAGSDANALDSSKNTALHWAALNGHDQVIGYLLLLTNPMLRTTSGKTALHLAALGGAVTHELLRRMLVGGYDGGAKDRMGRLALHYAALSGYEDGVVVLSEAGELHLDIEDLENMRPVDLAASRGYQKLAERLLTQGALSSPQAEGVSLPSISGTVLHRAAAGNCDELLGYLISDCGMNPSEPDLVFATPLHYAARSGSLAALKFLIESSGVDMMADRTMFGATALHEAAENGHQGCVLYLESRLGRGEPWPVDWSLRTPLHMAAGRVGNVHVLRTMLEMGCPIDQRDESGTTALHYAARSGDTAMADLLLNWPPQKAQIDAETNVKNEALSYAAVGGHLEMVKLLTKNGANIDKKNAEGQTPLLAAAECRMAIISETGGPKSIADYDTRVTFMERRVEVMRYLLEAGANPDTVDELGKLGSEKSSVVWKPQERWTRGHRKMYLDILFLSGVLNTPPSTNSI